MIVTVEWLKSRDACTDRVRVFEDTFGESVEVTRESLTRAYGAGLSLDWFGRKAFGDAYEAMRAAAWKVYKEEIAPAWKAYYDAMADASQEVIALAWKVYQKAKTEARKAYEEALIEVILKLSQVTSTP